MNLAVILPPHPLDPAHWEQAALGIALRLGGTPADWTLLAPTDHLERHRRDFPALPLAPWEASSVGEGGSVVFVQTVSPWAARENALGSRPLPRFTVDRHGGVRPLGRAVGPEDDPQLESHVFNRLGPRDAQSAWAYHYFPWSALYRDASWGPLDPFGHRIPQDLELLRRRAPNHFLIGGFGGSAAFGWECLPDQLWTHHLEEGLNRHCLDHGLPTRFTVLNFAGPGHVVLNEMFHYLLFAHRLPLDLVISHGGTNDLWNGQMSDPFLLEHDITYQESQEDWAQILHDSRDRPTVYSTRDEVQRSVNPPGVNLRAYVARIRQFRQLAEGNGARFLWGLQPMLFSRPRLSDQEAVIPTKWKPRDEEPRRRLPQLFALLEQNLPPDLAEAFLNHHARFARYDDDATLFRDLVHPAPEGQARIARHYVERIRDALLPGWLSTPPGETR
ncbi:MAG: hypothetical protein HQL51_09570 [Magnetococcales bacterium]|nr:hypothetical protein [Magnetococcales bacterium]